MLCINNYINGNLKNCKVPDSCWGQVFKSLRNDYGYGEVCATAITDFMTGQGSWDKACQAEQNKHI